MIVLKSIFLYNVNLLYDNSLHPLPGNTVWLKSFLMPGILTFTPNPCIDKIVSVPVLLPDKKLHCTIEMRQPGGGGINVARVINRLGLPVTALFPSGGSTGDLLQQLLHDEGVTTIESPVAHVTRENIMLTEKTSNRQYRLGMPGEALSAEEWDLCLQNIRKVSGLEYLVVSGSFPERSPKNIFKQIAVIAKEKGWRLIVDSSGASLREAVNETVFLLKPNLSELAYLTGKEELSESQAIEAARSLVREKHCEVVVVSMDARGAILVSDRVCIRAIPPVIKPKSTVGAGDSMVGAMVYSLCRGADLEEVLRMGVACGTAAIMNPGTTLCKPADAINIHNDIQLLPLGVF